MDRIPDHHEYCTGGFHPDDIVISGIAGRFPECRTVGELKEGLYSKKNMMVFRDTRYEKGCFNVPYSSCGLVPDLDKFDNTYFCLALSFLQQMDPSTRIHMEVTYEALADAGYNALDMKGLNIGVYNATTSDDAQRISLEKKTMVSLSLLRNMHPNRTSFTFDWYGPSYVIDSACSSSAIALWTAVNDVREGRAAAAIVSGTQLNLSPDLFQGYYKTGIASKMGNSRPFDSSTDGMQRTEGITALFIEKASTARRAYATIKAVRLYGSGHVNEGIGVPSTKMEKKIMLDTLEEGGVKLEDIQYVEAHGTGTTVGDPIELNCLAELWQNREEPLYVGTIKSNIGHTEACSGICGVIKACLAFETGFIAPNLNYENPNPNIPGLVDGRLKVVTEPLPLKATHIPVTSLGFGGTLVEILLKQHPVSYEKLREAEIPLPRLVLYPATTEKGVLKVLDFVKDTPDLKNEFFALLSKLSYTPPALKPYRGYGLYKKGKPIVTDIKRMTTSAKRQVWYVMTGMGCQWSGMGLQLMKLDVFAESMRKCAAVLKPFGIDLLELLKPNTNYLNVHRNITPCFVGICSIQIALVDVLKKLGIEPDGMVGHSTGEIICAYADGCLTLEQTILACLWRGKAVEAANLPAGEMAAVGLSFQRATELCPESVFAVCDNADDSVTISGLKEPLEKFVEQLTADNVFARIVNACGYAFHCKHVYAASPELKREMAKFIPQAKARSSRWISSSYPEEEWESDACKFASADYFVHNLMSTVLFNSAVRKIPSDAIVIEIGPHYLLQSLLKRSVGTSATFLGLMKKNEQDNMAFLFEQLGKLYNEGVDPKIELLYPPVQFPVPRGTPMISDLIEWDHSYSFDVPVFTPTSGEFMTEIKPDKEDAYLLDHRIDGRSLFPATGYIYLAWEAFAAKLEKSMFKTAVVIQNFKIHRATIITARNVVYFSVNILDSSGKFEIMEGKSLVGSGEIFEAKTMTFEEEDPVYEADDYTAVSGKDIYNELKMIGYEYGPCFQGLVETNMEATAGIVRWEDRWISFLDSLLLFFGLITRSKGFYLPTGAMSFKIDPTLLHDFVSDGDSKENSEENKSKHIPVNFNPRTNICRSVGVEISNLLLDPAAHRGKDDPPVLEKYTFLPYISTLSYMGDTLQQISHYKLALNAKMTEFGKQYGKEVKQCLFCVDEDDEFVLEEFMDTISDEHKLLSVIKDVHENASSLAKKRKDWFKNYVGSCGIDLLNNSLIDESSLRIVFEVIAENTYRKLSVLEFNANFPVVTIPMLQMMNKYSHMKFKKCTLVSQKTTNEDKEILEEHNIQLISEENLTKFYEEKNQDLAIGSFVGGNITDLQERIKTLTLPVKPAGFILLFFKEKLNPAEKFLSALCADEFPLISHVELEKCLHDANLVTLSKVSDSNGSSLYLLRQKFTETAHKIIRVTDTKLDWVEAIRKELETKQPEPVWLVSQDSPISGIIGMVNCLKQEPGGERIRSVFISQNENEAKLPPFEFENPFYKHIQERNLLMNVWRDGAWGSFRHVLLHDVHAPKIVQHSYVSCRKVGDLSSLTWVEAPTQYLEQEHKLVHIYYAGLNFRDVMLASGKIGGASFKDTALGYVTDLGLEYSGRDEKGRRVCGFIHAKGLATSALARVSLFDVPEHWSLEQAATVPVVYSTCYYALIMRAQMKPREKILIHSGTGGIGLAAISIALSMDCEIYTTVGNEEKRAYLKKKFPQLNDENIGCSRDITFKNMVLNGTNGLGVDIVLNSLADDKFQASLRCMRKGGRFVEIGKYDMMMDRQIGLKMFLDNISFIAVFLDQLFLEHSHPVVKQIEELVNDGIRKGVVKPLDTTLFKRDDAEAAFRYMSKGIHVGKVLLKIREEEKVRLIKPQTLMLPALPITYFYENKVYIIVGGLGGFGIEVTKWMVEKHAKNIILTSRFGERTPYHYLCLKRWYRQGINVQVSTLNVAIRSEAEQLLKEAQRIGPVGGIFNSAVVLKDAFMDGQTAEDYEEVLAPKATASKNLDELSRQLCPDLDLFVCFSSISCGRGNAGQTNYGYANSVMERICEERRRVGLHGLAIQWGIIGEVGVVHRHMGDDAMIAGVIAQSVASCLNTMDTFIQQDCPVVTSYVTAAAAKKLTQGDTLAQIVKILGMNDISEINPLRNFGEMGIDSMVGVEIKQMIESYCDVTVTLQEIQEMKIDDIKALFAKADTEKDTSVTMSLMSTTRVKIPSPMLHTEPRVYLNPDGTDPPIFIVNTGDSEISEFKKLADCFARPVVALVWSKDCPCTDVSSLASYYLQIIRQIAPRNFNLIGHALGGNVAFEMALQSDRNDGNVRSLTLIGGSDDLCNLLSKDETDSKDPEVTALNRFVEQFMVGGVPRLEEELSKGTNLEQRISTVLNYLTASSSQSVNSSEISEAISNFLQKFNMVQSYVPSGKLSIDINLFEDPTKVLANDVTVIKELFSQVCSGKVSVHRIFSSSQLATNEAANHLSSVLKTIIKN